MKKLLTIVLSICMLSSMLFGLIGCGHTHKWDSGTTLTEATCTSEGLIKYTCSECEQTKTEVIPTASHDWDNGTVTTQATCSTDGLKTSTCGNCGTTQTEVISKTGHTYSIVETIEAGCLTHGHVAYACGCGASYEDVIPAKGKHNTLGASWNDVTTAGSNACSFVYTPTTQCQDCGATIRGQSHESEKHTYKAEITTQATCSEKGVLTYKCNSCDDFYTEEIAKAPNVHTWVELSDSEFTHECSGCGAKKKEIDFSNTTTATLSKLEMSEEVSIKTEKATLQPDAALVEALGENVELSADTITASELENVDIEVLEKIGDSPVYDFSLKDGDNDVDFNGGKMVISVPYFLEEGEDPNSICVWYINGQNEPEEISATYDSATGTATFTVEHFSFYTVVRLTRAERCQKLGHSFVETEFNATCSQDGYTLKVCKRCDKIERVQGDEALGHSYEKIVTPATCTAQGYTTNMCSRENCNAQYVSDYTDIIAHSFVSEPVDSTCSSEGYVKNTCSVCEYSYKASTIAKKEHTFVNGTCSVCDFVDGTYVEPNIYFNLLESMNLADGLTINVPNIVVKVSMPGENGSTSTRTITISEMFTYKIDEDGYIVGKGQINMSMAMDGEKEEQSMTIAFKDGKLYSFDKGYNTYTVMSQDTMFEDVLGPGVSIKDIGPMISGMIPQDILSVIQAIAEKGSNPINKILAGIIEFIYEKEETEFGYKFTFNEENLSEVYEVITTKKINEVLDVIFGENTYSSILTFANELPDTLVKDLNESMAQITENCGITFDYLVEVIQAYVDSSMGAQEGESLFPIKEFLDGNKDKTIAELAALFMGEEATVEQFKEFWAGKVTEIDQMLKGMKLIDLISMFTGMQIDEQTLTMVGSIVEYAESLLSQGLVVSFETDKDGNFVRSYTSFNQLNIALSDSIFGGAIGDGSASPLSNTKEGIENGGASQPSNSSTMSITINGSMNVEKEGSVALDVNKIIENAESRRKAFKVPTEAISIGNGYQLIPVGDKLLLVYNYDYETFYGELIGEATYNGVDCLVGIEKIYYSTYLFSANSMSIEDSCLNWIDFYFGDAQYIYGAVYKVYLSPNGDVLGVELDIEATLAIDDTHQSGLTIYYNPKTDKYQIYNSPHNYVVTEENKPEGCDKWWTVVRTCKNCNHQEVERWNTGHEKTTRTIELVDASKGCAGGAVIKETCLACNKVVHQEELSAEDLINEDGIHTTFWLTDTIETDCGHLVVEENKCPCGQQTGSIWVNGACQFDYIESEYSSCEFDEDGDFCKHGYNDHYTEVYRCAVTDCAYTYRVEKIYIENAEGCNRTTKWIIKYYFTSGNEEKIFQSTQIHTWTEHGDVSTEERQEGDLLVVENSCSICGNTFQITKTIQMDCGCNKTVYYYDNYNNYGYEREYLTSCSYNEYSLDKNGNRIENSKHFYGNDHNDKESDLDLVSQGSCSQPTIYQTTCHCCGKLDTEVYYPNGHSYDGNGNCYYCGTTNYNEADGAVILEDLSTESEIIIGYYNRIGGKAETYIEFFVGDFIELSQFGLTLNIQKNAYAEDFCGLIIISKAQLAEILSQQEIIDEVVIFCYGIDSYEFSYDYYLNFTFDEIFGEQEGVGDAGSSNDANVGGGENSNEGDIEDGGYNGEENLGNGENGGDNNGDYGENDYIINGTEGGKDNGSSDGNMGENDFIFNNKA